LKGALRPVLYLSSRTALVVLLAVSTTYSQQQKLPAAPPGQASKPLNPVVSETNDRIAQLASASNVTQGDYLIGSGDLLGIDVFDVPELSREVRVNETGFISLPLMPSKIKAGGMTPYQLQDKLAELLQTNGLVSTPQVSVSVKEQHSQPITVIGAVKNPMVIQALRKTTLLQALSQAGGAHVRLRQHRRECHPLSSCRPGFGCHSQPHHRSRWACSHHRHCRLRAGHRIR